MNNQMNQLKHGDAMLLDGTMEETDVEAEGGIDLFDEFAMAEMNLKL